MQTFWVTGENEERATRLAPPTTNAVVCRSPHHSPLEPRKAKRNLALHKINSLPIFTSSDAEDGDYTPNGKTVSIIEAHPCKDNSSARRSASVKINLEDTPRAKLTIFNECPKAGDTLWEDNHRESCDSEGSSAVQEDSPLLEKAFKGGLVANRRSSREACA
jgi:hypothetical protein